MVAPSSDGALVRSLLHHAGITSIAFTSDGEWLVIGSYDAGEATLSSNRNPGLE
jgi:WD40 repeat protein